MIAEELDFYTQIWWKYLSLFTDFQYN